MDRLLYCYRGLVKWYDRGLQNLWWEFDSLVPCKKKTKNRSGIARAVLSYRLFVSVCSDHWIEEYPNPLQIASTGTAFEQSGQLSGA